MEANTRIIKTTEGNCHNSLEERLAEQDRISFKAGQEHALSDQAITDMLHQERQAGRMEVVEWIKSNIEHGFPHHAWEAQLKEWGVIQPEVKEK